MYRVLLVRIPLAFAIPKSNPRDVLDVGTSAETEEHIGGNEDDIKEEEKIRATTNPADKMGNCGDAENRIAKPKIAIFCL